MIWASTSSWSVSWTSFPDPPKGAAQPPSEALPASGEAIRGARLDTRARGCCAAPAMWKKCAKPVENVWIPVENPAHRERPNSGCAVFPTAPPSNRQFANNQSCLSKLLFSLTYMFYHHFPHGKFMTIIPSRQLLCFLLIRSIATPLKVSNRGVSDPVDIRGSLPISRRRQLLIQKRALHGLHH